MRRFFLAASLCLSHFFTGWIHAQPGQIDPSFNAGTGPNGAVHAIAPLGGGGILVGGNFSQWNGEPSGSVVKLNGDGSVDASFTTDLSIEVGQLYVQQGGVIAAGANAFGESVFVRLLGNGERDTNFSILPGRRWLAATEDYLYTVWIPPRPRPQVELRAPDGTQLANLYSGSVGDQPGRLVPYTENRVFMLGALYFGRGVLFGPSGSEGVLDAVRAPYHILNLAVAPDATFYGAISTSSNVILQRFNADRSVDPNFLAASSDNDVGNMAVQSDGRLVYGVRTLTRLNHDGSFDATFAPDFANSTIRALAVQPDGRILVGGALGSVNGEAVPNIVRLLAEGSVPEPEPPNVPPLPEGFTMSGRVTDGENGVAGVRVRTSRRNFTYTDENGYYTLTVPKAKRYVVKPQLARTRFRPSLLRVRVTGDVVLNDFVVRPRRR